MGIFDKFFGRNRDRESGNTSPDDPARPFRVGDRIHFPGQGLGRIDRIEEKDGQSFFALTMDSLSTIFVPVSNANAVVWHLPTRDEARRLRASLFQPSAPDPRPFSETSAHFTKTMTSGSLETYARFACRMLAAGKPASMAEKIFFRILDANLFAPIAEVLAEDRAKLVREVSDFQQRNALAPAIPSDAPKPPTRARELPDAPRADGAKYFGTFDSRGAILVGSPTRVAGADDSGLASSGAVGRHRVESRPASWHAYVHFDGADAPTRLVVVRSDAHSGSASIAAEPIEVARVMVDGGRIAILDEAVCSDTESLESFTLSSESFAAYSNGCVSSSAGDGAFTVRVATDAEGPVSIDVALS